MRLSTYAGHPNNETIIPTYYLAPVLQKGLDRVNAGLADICNGAWKGSARNEGKGAIEIVTERAVMSLAGHVSINGRQPSADSLKRRIWGIVNEESSTASAIYADALLLACDINYEDEALPELPAGQTAADEMVDAYFEFSDEEPDPETRRELARLLYRFSLGFSNGERVIEQLEAEVEEVEEGELVAA